MKETTEAEDAAFHAVFGKDAEYYMEGYKLTKEKALVILGPSPDLAEVQETILMGFDWESTIQGNDFWSDAHLESWGRELSSQWRAKYLPIFEFYVKHINGKDMSLEDML